MDLSCDLAPFSDRVRDAYLELLPDQEQAVARGKLEWKFRDNPAGAGLIATASDGGRILGVNAFMASAFEVEDRPARGYQSMDTIVDPAARGMGVFARLVQCFYEKSDGALLYGFPNVKSSPGFFGKLGWSYFGPVPMLIRPLRAGYFLKRIAKFMPDFPLPLLAPRSPEAKRIERFGDDAAQTWNRFSAGIGCAIRRDADYLNWRLADHPTERYDILQAPDGAFVASVVSGKHGGRIGYLMEAIGGNETLAPLIAASLHDMKSKRADAALAWCLPWSPNYAAYRKAGFYPFPARMRPITINFGARPLTSTAPAIGSPGRWYISYLDSDTV